MRLHVCKKGVRGQRITNVVHRNFSGFGRRFFGSCFGCGFHENLHVDQLYVMAWCLSCCERIRILRFIRGVHPVVCELDEPQSVGFLEALWCNTIGWVALRVGADYSEAIGNSVVAASIQEGDG